jgi:hypothetical protein
MHDGFKGSMFTKGIIYLDVVIHFFLLGIYSKGLVPQRPKNTYLLIAPSLDPNMLPF